MYIGGKWLCNRYKKQRRDVSDGIPTLVKLELLLMFCKSKHFGGSNQVHLRFISQKWSDYHRECHQGRDGQGDQDDEPDDEQNQTRMPFRGLEAEDQHHSAIEHNEQRDGDHKDGGDHHQRNGDE